MKIKGKILILMSIAILVLGISCSGGALSPTKTKKKGNTNANSSEFFTTNDMMEFVHDIGTVGFKIFSDEFQECEEVIKADFSKAILNENEQGGYNIDLTLEEGKDFPTVNRYPKPSLRVISSYDATVRIKRSMENVMANVPENSKLSNYNSYLMGGYTTGMSMSLEFKLKEGEEFDTNMQDKKIVINLNLGNLANSPRYTAFKFSKN